MQQTVKDQQRRRLSPALARSRPAHQPRAVTERVQTIATLSEPIPRDWGDVNRLETFIGSDMAFMVGQEVRIR